MDKHTVDLSGLNEEERNAVEVVVMGLLTKHMLLKQRDDAAKRCEPLNSGQLGWLIEVGNLCVALPSCHDWNDVFLTTFTNPLALRFARKEDAERCARILVCHYPWLSTFSVNAHRWG